jgi:hypothetical protein
MSVDVIARSQGVGLGFGEEGRRGPGQGRMDCPLRGWMGSRHNSSLFEVTLNKWTTSDTYKRSLSNSLSQFPVFFLLAHCLLVIS